MITGRRPMRSERRPHTLEKRNCISEKEPRIIPKTAPLAPYCFAQKASIGTTMPKPSKSMKTVRNRTRRDADHTQGEVYNRLP